MKALRQPVVIAISKLLALTVLGTSGCAVWRIKQSAELARQSEPYQASPPGATATLLIVGDSTAVGTGASSPASSLAALISRDHPQLKVVNRAKDGARFADIARQLETAGSERIDAILILGGGNDVIRLTAGEVLAYEVERATALAHARAGTVVLMPSGNVGSAPFFYPPWSWLMTARSKKLHAMVREAAASHGALYVNLFKEKADDPFAQRPDELNAKDGLHPSDAGYRLWYDELKAQADFSSRLAALRR
jgi:lysophospholipase L1-like esterase